MILTPRQQAESLSAQSQMAFQERMSNSAHQREVLDLKAAGLNPVLSAGGNGASTPNGAAGDVSGSQLTQLLGTAIDTNAKAINGLSKGLQYMSEQWNSVGHKGETEEEEDKRMTDEYKAAVEAYKRSMQDPNYRGAPGSVSGNVNSSNQKGASEKNPKGFPDYATWKQNQLNAQEQKVKDVFQDIYKFLPVFAAAGAPGLGAGSVVFAALKAGEHIDRKLAKSVGFNELMDRIALMIMHPEKFKNDKAVENYLHYGKIPGASGTNAAKQVLDDYWRGVAGFSSKQEEIDDYARKYGSGTNSYGKK